MTIATIDIGTNTVLLLIADVGPHGTIQTVAGAQRIIRLGRNVDASRTIRPEGLDKCADVLAEYREIIRSHGCERTVACGTSALRDASNRDEFLAAMSKRTGITVEVISGDEEALWTFRGGRLVLGPTREECTVLDIGGGSTEFIVGSDETVHFKKSIDIGAVRLTERFIHSDPILPSDESLFRQFLRDQLADSLRAIPPSSALVGVAGTITTLAAMMQHMTAYDAARINGFRLSMKDLQDMNARLSKSTLAEKKSMPGLQPERADVIHAGAVILEEAMRFLRQPEVIVSDHGLRYGLVLREIERMEKGAA